MEVKKCKYCEIKNTENQAEREFRENQRITVVIGNNMHNRSIHYLEIIPKTMTGEYININYCPMCGRKLV